MLGRIWPEHISQEDLINEMDSAVQIPGSVNAWTMPIKNRIDMLATGIRTPVGVKVFGSNLDEIQRIGERVEGILRNVPHQIVKRLRGTVSPSKTSRTSS
jgi:Cu(I)/Ag(I) efflux system membrane protein CusA/SilA